MADKAKGHLGNAVDAAGDLYTRGADRAQDAIAEMPASLSDASAAGERLVRHGRERLHQGVRKQPVEALLLAGAIGYLVGWATSRS